MGINYKRKRKYNYNLLIIFAFLLIVTIISVGYSLWTSSLEIQGTVIAVSEPQLPFTILPSGRIMSQITIPDLPTSVMECTNQYIEGNTIHIDYLVYSFQGTPRVTNISFGFQNSTQYTFYGGTSSYVLSGQTGTVDGSVAITIPSTLDAGQIGNINIRIPLKFNKFSTFVDITCTITYLINNEPQSLNVVVHLTKS